jgi:hypothetical protein
VQWFPASAEFAPDFNFRKHFWFSAARRAVNRLGWFDGVHETKTVGERLNKLLSVA